MLRWSSVLTAVLLAVASTAPVLAEAPAHPQTAGSPVAIATSRPVPPATPAAPSAEDAAACRKAVTGLDSGDASALKALPVGQRKALVAHNAEAEPALTCVAIAQASPKPCDLLEQPARDNCAEQARIADALKSTAPNAVKSRLFSIMCSHGDHATKADCERLDQAIVSGDATRCPPPKDVPLNFCAALATNDPAKCPQTDPAIRAICAAFVSEDPSLCPKDAGDCVKIVGDLRTVKKEGLASANLSNPAMVGSKGIKACASLIATLKESCSASAAGATAPPPPSGNADTGMPQGSPGPVAPDQTPAAASDQQ